MANRDNMGVADSEFAEAGFAIAMYASALISMIEKYTSAVQTICDEGIQDQQICGRLGSLASRVSSLVGPLEEVAKQANKDLKSYIDAIDSADKFLY